MKQTSPILVVLATLALGLTSTSLAIWISLHQPWMGLTLSDQPGQGIRIEAVHTYGPTAEIIASGDRLLEISYANSPTAQTLNLEPQDAIEEPDTLAEQKAYASFMDRQDKIAAILAKGLIVLVVSTGERVSEHVVEPLDRRPLRSLPTVFWVQLGVGLVGILLAGWVMALRQHDRAVQYFLLAGTGLMISAHAAAIYSARELALPREIFIPLSRTNHLGTMTFGIGMINLFSVYPKRLAGAWAQAIIAFVFGFSIVAVYVEWPEVLQTRQIPVATAMLILLFAILAQVFVNRRDPMARAMLGWFGLAVLIGAGGFGLTVTLPILLGSSPTISQGYAFLFFLAIFVGLAMAIARYRLFELSEWSFRILFYVGGAVLLLVLDAALIFVAALERTPALGLSLAIVGLVYLPLRDAIGRWLRHDRDFGREELFALVTEVALASSEQERTKSLNTLLGRLFDPLHIEEFSTIETTAQLVGSGEALEIPMPHGMKGRRLRWAGQGRRLFSRHDQRIASLVIRLLDHTIARQQERDQAVEMERARINRDMHDNIGVHLLGALHSSDSKRKDNLIRQTLAELREIISRPSTEGAVLSSLLADLRSEISEHLDTAEIDLSWQDHGLTDTVAPDIALRAPLAQTLRSILRESVSNILRHSGANRALVDINAESMGEAGPLMLSILVADNGRKLGEAWSSQGNGLGNMRHRVEACGGTIDLTYGQNGTKIHVTLPLAVQVEN